MALEKKESWLHNNWTVGIGILFLTPIVNLIIDFVKQVPAKATNLWTTITYVIDFIFNYNLKVWWILCGICVIGIVKYIRDKQKHATQLIDANGELTERGIQEADKQNEAFNKKQEKMLQYTADKFLNYTWEWKWVFNNKIGIYEAKNILPCCPTIECELSQMKLNSEQMVSATYFCPKCQKFSTVNGGHFGKMEDEIHRYILAKVDNF